MADQFCRIACVGVCDMTLDSNGTQTLVTTDANCSFVIRDVYKSDSDPDNPILCFSGDLVMDGVTILSGMATGANGTLIVPPSTTLCYVEKSGNYPLVYTCYCHHRTLPAGTNCGGGTQYRHKIIGIKGSDECCIFNAPCITSICCNNQPNLGRNIWHPATCTYVMHYHDGNSTSSWYMFCKNCTTSACTPVTNQGGGYCVTAGANDMLATPSNTMTCFWQWARCGGACCCYVYVCNHSGTGWSTYSEHGISPEGHPCYHCGCRAVVEARDNGTYATNKLYHVNLCCSVSGLQMKSEIIWCLPKCSLPGCYQTLSASNDSYSLFTYWSKLCNNWLAGIYRLGTIVILNEDATSETVLCLGNDYTYACLTKVTTAGGKLFHFRNCTCKYQYIDLDSVLQGTEQMSDIITDQTYSGECNFCYEALGDGSSNYCTEFCYGPSTSTTFSGNSCDFPEADAKTSIRIYGIKST